MELIESIMGHSRQHYENCLVRTMNAMFIISEKKIILKAWNDVFQKILVKNGSGIASLAY